MVIPVMRPILPDPERMLPRLRQVRDSGVYANRGPQVLELEGRFAELFGVDRSQVVTTANATLGLEGAARTSDASDWSAPSFTFTATVSALLSAGKRVRLSDIHPDSWWLDASAVPRDHGLMPVAPFGAPITFDPWLGRRDVIIDAAASLGTMPDLSTLPATWCVVLSLHATKVLGAGEGGLVVCGSVERAEAIRRWTNFGLVEGRISGRIGTNAKMSELQAVCAHAVLDGRDHELEEWSAARALMEGVADAADLRLAAASRHHINPYCIAVLPDASTTDRVESTLHGAHIGTRRWWALGCHRMPAYADLPRDPLPVTEEVAGRTLGLPLHRGLTDEDASAIRAALGRALHGPGRRG